jgi:hypothetical protein
VESYEEITKFLTYRAYDRFRIKRRTVIELLRCNRVMLMTGDLETGQFQGCRTNNAFPRDYAAILFEID